MKSILRLLVLFTLLCLPTLSVCSMANLSHQLLHQVNTAQKKKEQKHKRIYKIHYAQPPLEYEDDGTTAQHHHEGTLLTPQQVLTQMAWKIFLILKK